MVESPSVLRCHRPSGDLDGSIGEPDLSARSKHEHGQDERGASSGSTWEQYELREYEVDPADLSAETVAAKIRLPPEQVFKTLAEQKVGISRER